MRTNEERAGLIQKRTAEIKRERQKRKQRALDMICIAACLILVARRKILCKRYSTKSRMALESRADSGLNPLFAESHGGQNGMRAGTA